MAVKFFGFVFAKSFKLSNIADRMEAFAAGADAGGARGAIFKQMAEMKKKIQVGVC